MRSGLSLFRVVRSFLYPFMAYRLSWGMTLWGPTEVFPQLAICKKSPSLSTPLIHHMGSLMYKQVQFHATASPFDRASLQLDCVFPYTGENIVIFEVSYPSFEFSWTRSMCPKVARIHRCIVLPLTLSTNV